MIIIVLNNNLGNQHKYNIFDSETPHLLKWETIIDFNFYLGLLHKK